MKKELLDLYIDYLICSTAHTTATGLSNVTNNVISHDKVTRFLSLEDFTQKDFWNVTKKFIRSIENEEGALIIDDTIEEKPYTDENDIIAWHFDHAKCRNVKGINIVSALYEAGGKRVPVGYKLVEKTKKVINRKTGKEKRVSPISKQQHCRDLIVSSAKNEVKFKYVLADSWFASSENMKFVKNNLGKNFIMPMKSNRLIALSEQKKLDGQFVKIDSLDLGEGKTVWPKGLDFPVCLVRQVFKNGDGSTGTLYLVSSDLMLTDSQITTIYKRRWKVEEYHQSLKNNASLAKSPTKTKRTQANHIFASICAFARLEAMSMKHKLNHFAIKGKIYLNALMAAFKQLEKFNDLSPRYCQTDNYHIVPA
jgi:hypothetical protein